MENSIDNLPVDITLDPGQKEVANIKEGRHVVCGGPGSGKTFMLALWLQLLLTLKCIEPSLVACFTVSRKAAAAMHRAVARVLSADKVKDVYVGGLYGKCQQLLRAHGVIPDNTGVVPDEDAIVIIRDMEVDSGMPEPSEQMCKDAIDVMHWMRAFRMQYPRALFGKHDSYNSKELRAIVSTLNLKFSTIDLVKVYDGIDDYAPQFPREHPYTLDIIRMARHWETYKDENHLMDFKDMLEMAYDYLRSPGCEFRKLKWVEVDETQDLTDFMLEIVNLMAAPEATIVYYADEQQAISSFMGTKLETLRHLMEACADRVHRLTRNHRSSPAITEAVNNFARRRLRLGREFWQEPAETPSTDTEAVSILSCEDKGRECRVVVDTAQELPEDERLAVIVPTKNDAAEVEAALLAKGITSLQMTGEDAFYSQGFRFICAHLAVLKKENDFLSWSRILEGLNLSTLQGGGACRRLLMDLRAHMLSPVDLLSPTGRGLLSIVDDTVKGEYVLFDTETSGLSTSTDDIVQLAAVKYRNGIQVDEFEVILHTDKALPPVVGGEVNPLIAEYQAGPVVSRREGLEAFMRFVGQAPLFAHNADFDYNILASNLYRDCGITDFYKQHPACYDTLRIARLVFPNMYRYNLKKLIEDLHLKGENTHLATDDVKATAELLNYCMAQYRPMAAAQDIFMGQINEIAMEFRARYRRFFDQGRSTLFALPIGNESAIVSYMRYLHDEFATAGYIEPVAKFDLMMKYIDGDIVDHETEPLLYDQIGSHMLEISTAKESDLCESSVVKERVVIATPFKIKGQQFDRVLVFHANDGVYPYFSNDGDPEKDNEDARKFYVAISRARKKLVITYRNRNTGISKYGTPYDRPASPSPFLEYIKG